MKYKRVLSGACAIVLLVCATCEVFAQALGSDMWTADFANQGLFKPHADYCDSSTEAFVAIAGSGRGFCIEKSERSSAAWEDAREDCAEDGKRLPEPGEYKFTCNIAGSLGVSGMDSGAEWVSNFALPVLSTNGVGGVFVAAGGAGCNAGSFGAVFSDAGESTYTYRCLH